MAEFPDEILNTTAVLFQTAWKNIYQELDNDLLNNKIKALEQDLKKKKLTVDTICEKHFILMRLSIAKYIKSKDINDLSIALKHFLKQLSYTKNFNPYRYMPQKSYPIGGAIVIEANPAMSKFDEKMSGLHGNTKKYWQNAFIEFDYLYAEDERLRDMVSQLDSKQQSLLQHFIQEARAVTCLNPGNLVIFPEMNSRTKIPNTLLKTNLNTYTMNQFCKNICYFATAATVTTAAYLLNEYMATHENNSPSP